MSADNSAIDILARSAKTLALQKLRQKRATAFEVFIFDLKAPEYEQHVGIYPENAQWEIRGGFLRIRPDASDETYAEVQTYLEKQLGDKPWFEHATQIAPAPRKSPPLLLSDGKPYHLPLKVLGKNGPNLAADAIILIQNENNPIKLLTIHRPDGTIAVPGGMNEDRAKATYTAELLEEVFSNALFSPDSVTESLINTLEIIALAQPIHAFFSQRKLAIHLPDSKVQSPADYIQAVLDAIDQHPATLCERTHLKTQLKCMLYKELLPAHYAAFKSIVENDLIELPQRINQSDSRNTDYAWMETKPFVRVMGKETFSRLEQEAGLTQLSGGDDAENAQLHNLEEFWTGDRPIFCDHGALVLEGVSVALQQGQLIDTKVLQQQIETIKERIQTETATMALCASKKSVQHTSTRDKGAQNSVYRSAK